MSDLLDDVVAAAGLTVFGAAPAADPAPLLPLPGPELAARIEALRGDLRARGLDHVVLLATGAPAAAARAIAATLGLRLTVLDSADPHRAAAALTRLDRAVLVAAAPADPSPETDAYLRLLRDRAEPPLVVVTAPGSALAALGGELFLTDASPLSALSAYGLVAPGLAGADTAALLDEAAALLAPAPPPAARLSAGFTLAPPAPRPSMEVAPSASPGAALGAAIAAATRAGRDKLAVAPDGTGIDGLGEWISELFPGVVPVALENPSSWGHEGLDVFSVTVGGVLGRGIMPGGGIASDLCVNGPLGAQLLAWEQAARMLSAGTAPTVGAPTVGAPTVGAPTGGAPTGGAPTGGAITGGALAGAVPGSGGSAGGARAGIPGVPASDALTTAPDLSEISDIAAEVPTLVEGAVEVYGDTSQATLIGAIDDLVRGVAAGGYVAISAYLDRDGDAAAAGMRDALAGRVARAVTFGWGGRPARPGLGATLQITGAVTGDVPVPGRPYTFGGLQAARAAAERRAGPVLRLHLTDRATGIDQLLAALGG
ncbi:hypothetical protein [Dactylosporangium sp. CA-139066]|uniref:hypothetical protein n=1 Tax=Dactylosporangium sp. CA-139066 TaxID=3239930 RepID=UPI003D8C39D3